MSTTLTTFKEAPRPQAGVLFGITHDLDRRPIIREAKVLKVGIGLPRGKALHVFIAKNGKWNLIFGARKEDLKRFEVDNRAAAEKKYYELKDKAPDVTYPRKAQYFVFSRQIADGTFEPDFDAIEKHGPVPTEIDIVFLSDDPFNGQYQMWSSSQLECSGDGVSAQMIPVRAWNDAQKLMAVQAKELHSKYFPVFNECWVSGLCPYSRPTNDNRGQEKPSLCKPSGDLKFQLKNNVRVGATAYFHTSGIRSVQQIFSALLAFKTFTGGGDPARGFVSGVPFKMLLRPYKTNHNGQAATQYGVSLEVSAGTLEQLYTSVIQDATKFRRAIDISSAPRMLEAGSEETFIEDEADSEEMRAKGLNAEFYPEGDDIKTGVLVDDEAEPGAQQAGENGKPASRNGLKDRVRARASANNEATGHPLDADAAQKWPERDAMLSDFAALQDTFGKPAYDACCAEAGLQVGALAVCGEALDKYRKLSDSLVARTSGQDPDGKAGLFG